MLFKDYLKESGLSFRKFSKRLSEHGITCSPEGVRRWTTGVTPRKKTVHIIKAISNGLVQEIDWYNS